MNRSNGSLHRLACWSLAPLLCLSACVEDAPEGPDEASAAAAEPDGDGKADSPPCAVTVTANKPSRDGSTAAAVYDRNVATGFRSSWNDWQYVTLSFSCPVQVTALRRKMTDPAGRPRRVLQGETVSLSSDGRTFTDVTHASSQGWETYSPYNLRAWSGVPYGFSDWLRLRQPVTARQVRFGWDGDGDSLDEIELRFGNAGFALSLRDVRLTQNGLVTRALPPMPLVAGKSALVRATVSTPDGGVPLDEAWLDVVREDTGVQVGSVRGESIAADDVTRSTAPMHLGDDVHFFVPGGLLAGDARYRFDLRMRSGASDRSQTLLAGISTAENAGLPMTFVDYDTGAMPDLTAFFRFVGVLSHTARVLPVKDSHGALLPAGASTRGADGLRYEYVHAVALPAQGSLGNFEREFVLSDMNVGIGQDPAGSACSARVPAVAWTGRWLATNFTGPEDTNRNGVFDPIEVARCTAAAGSNSAMSNRITNFLNRLTSEIEAQRLAIPRQQRTEAIRLGLSIFSGAVNTAHQNRSGWLGNAAVGGTAGWATLSLPPDVDFPSIPHEMVHLLGENHAPAGTEQLPGPAYDLFLKRRVRSPKHLMAGGFGGDHTLSTSFLPDAVWDAVRARFSAARLTAAPGDGDASPSKPQPLLERCGPVQ